MPQRNVQWQLIGFVFGFAGVDLEPNTPFDWMNNISFFDMTSKFNHGSGFSVAIGKLQCERDKCRMKPDCMCPLNPPLVTITVDGAVIQGASSLKLNASTLIQGMGANIGVQISAGQYSNGSQGWFKFSNVAVTETVQPGLEIYPKAPLSLPATFSDCLFDGVATAPEVRWGGQNVPMLLHQSSYGPIGGFSFDNVTVRDGEKRRPWLKCDSCGSSRGPALAISGTVSVQNSKGCSTKNVPTEDLKVTCTRIKSDDSSTALLHDKWSSSLCGPGDACWPSAAQWAALNASLGGRLAAPGSAGYGKATVMLSYNDNFRGLGSEGCSANASNLPAFAVLASSEEHIQTAMKFAAEARVQVSVKNSGHTW